MKHISLLFVAVVVVTSGFATSAWSQDSAKAAAAVPHVKATPGTIVIPKSSVQQAPPAGHKFVAHTNIRFLVPGGFTPQELPPFAGFAYETPASLACVYGLVAPTPGCNPNLTTKNPTGGSRNIAIVDAYDDPDAPGDLAWFSLQFGIPLTASQFQVVWADTSASSCSAIGVPVDPTGGWEQEEALDIEWSHAMAPNARIWLVEACSNFDSDLQQAVLVANNLIQCANPEISASGVLGKCPAGSNGKGEVSMSWGGGEFVGENGATGCADFDDSCFTTPDVVYVAGTGDTPGVVYPSTSRNVIAAGGLTTRRSNVTGNLIGSTGWVEAGGGQSAIETIPAYQSSISGIVGGFRGVPDISFDADPNTGVWVYDTFPVDEFEFFQWWVFGGTSVATPSLAGIINRAGHFAPSSGVELTTIYANQANAADFSDITSAYCGPYMGFTATTGWDFCTGVGAVKGYAGK